MIEACVCPQPNLRNLESGIRRKATLQSENPSAGSILDSGELRGTAWAEMQNRGQTTKGDGASYSPSYSGGRKSGV